MLGNGGHQTQCSPDTKGRKFGQLDRILQIRGYTCKHNADAVQSRLALPGRQIGLMAQEVERVFPDWVAKDTQGYRYVTECSTTALMVEAL